MIERVARALWVADGQPDQYETYADELRVKARAAIAAMREPTEGMIECAGYVSDYSDLENIFAHSWRAMIDEALKDA